MKNKLSLFFCFFISAFLFSQTYELTGNPINTNGWSLVSDAVADGDNVRLTLDQTWQVGSVNLNEPINLNYCKKWKVEFDFRIDGVGTSDLKIGDGMAFWYLVNPPSSYVSGEGLGIPQNAVGLMVGFDTFNNSNNGQMNKIHLLYGVNTGNIEFNNTPGSTFHTPDLTATNPFVGSTFRHVEVTGEADPSNPANTIIKLWLQGNLIISGSFKPSGAAASMNKGYFGFSASTGGASARHAVKNVKIFVDKIPVLQNSFTPSLPCPDIDDGTVSFDLTTYIPQIVSNPPDYTFSFFENGSSAPIADPEHYTFTSDKTITVVVHKKTNDICDNDEVKIHLNINDIVKNDALLEVCGSGTQGIFDLSDATVTSQTDVSKKYFLTLADLMSDKNEITNFSEFESGTQDIYVKLTHISGCFRYAKISLVFKQMPVVYDAELKECFLKDQPDSGKFDLTKADVTAATGVTTEYYPSENDAEKGTNMIGNPTEYISPSKTVYAKVKSTNKCYEIIKIDLFVVSPVVINEVITDHSVTKISVSGGIPPYQYSVDNSGWQDSNEFTIEGGIHTFRVKDSFGCNIAEHQIVLQNLPNVITPNDDGINDIVDFSLLAKKNNLQFRIVDRYGFQVFSNQETSKTYWDGKENGRAVKSGVYWYILSWNETNTNSTFLKYTGWILVKNR